MSLILAIFFVQKFITRSTLKTTKIQVFWSNIAKTHEGIYKLSTQSDRSCSCCVRGINVSCFYGFSDGFWNCPDSVTFCVFHFISTM